MEMMDLGSYVDSLRSGYQRSMNDLQTQYRSMAGAWTPDNPWSAFLPAGMGGAQARHGRHGRGCGCGNEHHGDHGPHRGHDHRPHEHDRDCDCGCGEGRHHHRRHCADCDEDCRCDCCIRDADIVLYARCGEIRVVPIEIENDTRKVREDVSVELSDIRSAGGKKLPWQARVDHDGPLTLEACSTTKLGVWVRVQCRDSEPDDNQPGEEGPGEGESPSPDNSTSLGRQNLRLDAGEVDHCVVGYLTVRVSGCVVRPIVIAIAALPNDCGAYETGCSCSCC